mgnify:CR=1 FL=1
MRRCQPAVIVTIMLIPQSLAYALLAGSVAIAGFALTGAWLAL